MKLFRRLLCSQFKPSLKNTLLTILLGSVLLGLGFWQLHRAQEKEDLLRLAREQVSKSPSWWRVGMPAPSLYQQVILRGHYLPYTLLLDNQHFDHQWGYHVLSPLLIAKGQVVLVDRGWVVGDLRRVVLPSIAIPAGQLLIQGQIYYPSSRGFILGEEVEPHGDSLMVIERIDTKLISNLLHNQVYPFIIRLDKFAEAGYVREWPIVAMPPQRHYAYALQWFAMALVLFVLYFVLNLRARGC